MNAASDQLPVPEAAILFMEAEDMTGVIGAGGQARRTSSRTKPAAATGT